MKIKELIIMLLIALSLSITNVPARSYAAQAIADHQAAANKIEVKVLAKKAKKKKVTYVYVTGTEYGKKYHRKSCRTIKRSKKVKLTKSKAKARGYKRCKVCKP